MSRFLAIAAALFGSILIVGQVTAAPLGVRAGVTVEGHARFHDESWSVDFSLQGDDGTPLPLQPLNIVFGGVLTVPAVTDAAGRAAVLVPPALVKAGSVTWNARFLGTARHAACESAGTADLSRIPVELRVTTSDGPFGLDTPAASVRVTLETADEKRLPLADTLIRIRLHEGPAQFARTGSGGDLDFVLRPDLLLAPSPSPGPLAIDVLFEGDAAFGPASGRAVIPRRVLARVTLRVAREGDAASGRLRFSGRASHEFGAYSDAMVRLSIEDEHGTPLLQLPALAGVEGIWNASISLDALRALGVPRVSVRAHLATRGALFAAKSEALRLDVPKTPGRSVLWPALGLLAVIVVIRLLSAPARRAIAAFVVRLPARIGAFFAGCWRRLVAFLPHASPLGPAEGAGVAEPVLLQARHDGARVLRRDVIAITVRDRDTGHPITVAAQLIDEAGSIVATAHGHEFDISGTPPGKYKLSLTGRGLFPIVIDAALPHDGSLDGAVVSMRRVERRLRELHEANARRYGEEPAWGLLTPREVGGRLAARPDTATTALPAEVGALIVGVEMAYFAAEPPTPGEVEALEDRLREADAKPPEGS